MIGRTVGFACAAGFFLAASASFAFVTISESYRGNAKVIDTQSGKTQFGVVFWDRPWIQVVGPTCTLQSDDPNIRATVQFECRVTISNITSTGFDFKFDDRIGSGQPKPGIHADRTITWNAVGWLATGPHPNNQPTNPPRIDGTFENDVMASADAVVRRFLDDSRSFNVNAHPDAWLGISVLPISDEIAQANGIKPPRGALIANVAETGSARVAGIEPGDVIVGFDGLHIDGTVDLATAIREARPGDTVGIVLIRRGKEENRRITIGRLLR